VTIDAALVAAGVPQHVEMHRERQACALAEDLDLPFDGIRRDGIRREGRRFLRLKIRT
jgi:hypothetical protein